MLLFLLSADLVFALLHIIFHTLGPDSLICNISGLCSHQYANIYHLGKLFWIIILLAYILKSTRYSGYVSWILMFLFFLLDDALLLHQNIGDYLANKFDTYLPPNLSLQPRHFELTVLAIAGMLLLIVVAWAYFHGPREFRAISNDLLLFIVAYVFFGLVVDLATAVKLGSAVVLGLVIVEDAGELVVDSLILWYVFLLAIHNGKPDGFLHDLLYKPHTP
jgi:hypothetical protein